jgi:hypothetical protein
MKVTEMLYDSIKTYMARECKKPPYLGVTVSEMYKLKEEMKYQMYAYESGRLRTFEGIPLRIIR